MKKGLPTGTCDLGWRLTFFLGCLQLLFVAISQPKVFCNLRGGEGIFSRLPRSIPTSSSECLLTTLLQLIHTV